MGKRGHDTDPPLPSNAEVDVCPSCLRVLQRCPMRAGQGKCLCTYTILSANTLCTGEERMLGAPTHGYSACVFAYA